VRLPDDRSIVGMDRCSQGVAFVWFRGGELRDFAIRYVGSEPEKQLAVIEEILATTQADVLVLEDWKDARCRRAPDVKRLFSDTAARATAGSIEVGCVAQAEVRDRNRRRGLKTKEAVAAAVAQSLPELRRLVPARRKAWMSEDPRVNIFDAVSLVLRWLGADESNVGR